MTSEKQENSNISNKTVSSPHLKGWTGAISTAGNADILNCHKTAFLCSRRYPASAVLRIYDWANEMKENGQCVVSGFHSRLEQDVLEILLGGKQPLILAAARGLPKRYNANIKNALKDGRLLVVSPFPDTTKRITAQTAQKRNEFMIAIADRIVVGYAKEGGMLDEALKGVPSNKELTRLTG